MVTADHPLELLLHEQRPSVAEPRRRKRLSRRGWWVLSAASVSVLGIVVGLLVTDQVHERNQFDHSRATLVVTHQRITAVSAQLAALQHELAILTTQVGNDTTAYNQVASQLNAAQTALGSAQTHVTQETSQITSLQTCLGGVEQALNALAVDNQLGAFAALESVSTSCTTAAASNG